MSFPLWKTWKWRTRANRGRQPFFIHPRKYPSVNIRWTKLRLLRRLPGTYFSEEAGKTAPSFGVRHKLWRHPHCASSIQFHQATREMNDVWGSTVWSSNGGGGGSASVWPAAICHGDGASAYSRSPGPSRSPIHQFVQLMKYFSLELDKKKKKEKQPEWSRGVDPTWKHFCHLNSCDLTILLSERLSGERARWCATIRPPSNVPRVKPQSDDLAPSKNVIETN